MKNKYTEYKKLDLVATGEQMRKFWEAHNVFIKSMQIREGKTPFVFYEGPPSANGVPGIHHVMARSIKDIFCRYKTLKGYYVERKAGWDTHGLPVELGVEKQLGITKEDIGKKISIEDYNKACRVEVMKYKDLWDELTQKMGYWVDLDSPYITFDNKYIETCWYLLKQFYEKDLLYKGFTIQPYSPAAGTGLSSHELNLPGCYQTVKDQTVIAQFKAVINEDFLRLWGENITEKGPTEGESIKDIYFLAWTTTPWTLPSNTALCVGANIDYIAVATYNPYTGTEQTVILGRDLLHRYFAVEAETATLKEMREKRTEAPDGKQIPYCILKTFKGSEFTGLRYEQLIDWAQPDDGDAFRIITGDFVTTEDGTGIVHIAPSFGADDFRVAKKNGIGSLTLVDRQGKFTERAGDNFKGRFVKPQYEDNYDPKTTKSVDVDIIIMLKQQNKAFKTEKHEHSYPHCWRTDKPVLYYPLDSWFIRTTALKERMINLNKTINWKPESTGTGRFAGWLENLVDWNLSRSRYWGIPLPIWTTADRVEQICIGSLEELKTEIEKAVKAGVMTDNPLADFTVGDFSKENYEKFDMHRPYVDEIILVSPSGKKMFRESDLIDVWFDSGSMPYAQLHYPFENASEFKMRFPADFIAEGVDQTRGWFFTMHAIASMLFDNIAYKNVVSNGLVLDKNGNKMSKRLGNGVDPFETIDKYGADATRWYMITNAQPWENIKFDIDGIGEVQRRFFGTLYNTYSFFSLYANIDGFDYSTAEVTNAERPELDRWILSELNTLIKNVDAAYSEYEPTRAGRLIQSFTDEHLSNWYVRLSRRRFWKSGEVQDKLSAYQTLYTCLVTISKLMSPIAPFFADRLYQDLNNTTQREKHISVHLADFPQADEQKIDSDLEERMELAQKVCSIILSLRKKTNNRVRQPLARVLIPILNEKFKTQIEAVSTLILSEVNVKKIEFLTDTSLLAKKIKPNFKTLGPRYGKLMKQIADTILSFSQEQISTLERDGTVTLTVAGEGIELLRSDVEIYTEDIQGFAVATEGTITVALDIQLSDELKAEGLARELVNRIQNLRKEKNFEVTDRIIVNATIPEHLKPAIKQNIIYITSEVLAKEFNFTNKTLSEVIDLGDGINIGIEINTVTQSLGTE
ncbi:MAG: isoleucine--tRNA ligase [Bacteroidales bacterium]|jgi:isoleucyl-tRNA synthetase|nr:isoleucine--tRNA ligase [Bacteroidales bacterium]